MKLLIAHKRASEYAALIRAEIRNDVPDLEILAATERDRLASLARDADIILAWRIPKQAIANAGNLKWLASTGAGVDHLLVPGLPSSVVITKAPPIFATAVAEYVMGYVLYVSLGIDKIISNIQGRLWSVPPHSHVSGKIMGILGMGTIGTRVGASGKAFGMRIWGVRRTALSVQDAEKIFGKEELAGFLPHVDFLVLTLPLTEETRNLIGRDEIALLKPDCWIINVSRGGIVNEEDLAQAICKKRVGGYVSDVFASEPLPQDSPLWGFENVIITPHYAALTEPAVFVPYFAENLRRFARGEDLLFQIDRERGY